jgi:hypothetical protein
LVDGFRNIRHCRGILAVHGWTHGLEYGVRWVTVVVALSLAVGVPPPARAAPLPDGGVTASEAIANDLHRCAAVLAEFTKYIGW